MSSNINFKITPLGKFVLAHEYHVLKPFREFMRCHFEDELKEVSEQLFESHAALKYADYHSPCFVLDETLKSVKMTVKHNDKILACETCSSVCLDDLLDWVETLEGEEKIGSPFSPLGTCVFRILSTPNEVLITFNKSDRASLLAAVPAGPDFSRDLNQALETSKRVRREMCEAHAISLPELKKLIDSRSAMPDEEYTGIIDDYQGHCSKHSLQGPASAITSPEAKQQIKHSRIEYTACDSEQISPTKEMRKPALLIRERPPQTKSKRLKT